MLTARASIQVTASVQPALAKSPSARQVQVSCTRCRCRLPSVFLHTNVALCSQPLSVVLSTGQRYMNTWDLRTHSTAAHRPHVSAVVVLIKCSLRLHTITRSATSTRRAAAMTCGTHNVPQGNTHTQRTGMPHGIG
eukprot:6473247-Prymnesium_polylepis.1